MSPSPATREPILLDPALPEPVLDLINEVGRVLSAKNESDLGRAVALIQSVLRQVAGGSSTSSDNEESHSLLSSLLLTDQRHFDLYADIAEAQNLGDWLESRAHTVWATMVDDLFGAGHLTREQYTTVLGSIGSALETFHGRLHTVWADAFTRGVAGDSPSPSAALSPLDALGLMMSTRDQDDDLSTTAEAVTKSEGDAGNFPASDYAYVPDREKPSTWKLRLTARPGGPPDPGIVGAAAAALGPGFRGQRVQLPADAVASVKARVRAAWRKANPDKDDDEMPPGIKESQYILITSDDQTDSIPLSEAAVARDGTMEIKIIQPGWGSSGYYPAEVLERDGPQLFKDGTHMYFDHPTRTEEKDRPERSVRDLAAVIVGPATYKKEAKAGEGLYANAAVLEPYRAMIEALAPHIGTSIRGAGIGKDGAKDGRKGKVFEQLIRADSVDLVTHAGAGGQILAVHESARVPIEPVEPEKVSDETKETIKPKEDVMPNTDEQGQESNVAEAMLELARLREAINGLTEENQRMRAREVAMDATAMVDKELSTSTLRDETKARLRSALIAQYPTKEDDHSLDRDTFRTNIREAIKDEVQYLISIGAGNTVRHMGISESTDPDEITPETVTTSMTEALKRLGLSDAGAAAGARGR